MTGMELYHFPSWSGEGSYNAYQNDLHDPYSFVNLLNWYQDTVFGQQAITRVLSYEYAGGYNEPYYGHDLSSIGAQTMGTSISGQSTDYATAREIAQAAISAFAPSFAWRTDGAILGEICYHKANTKVYRNTAYKTPAYLFVFTRSIADVPVTLVAKDVQASQMTDIPMSPAPNNESIAITVSDGQIVNFFWNNPYAIGEKLAESAALMPFQQIMDIFGTIAPLSIQSMENENQAMGGASNKLEITEIHLGYMPVLKKDDPNQWVLRPVWDFIGTRSFAREHYDWPCQSCLTIDAIDGTVIDRRYGY